MCPPPTPARGKIEGMAKRGGMAPILIGLAVAPTLLCVGYFLSVGPAIGLREAGLLSPETVDRVYRPLGRLAARSDLFRQALKRYVELWVP